VLLLTSYESTLATLLDGVQPSMMADNGPLVFTDLEPATEYTVEVMLLFLGGFEGEPSMITFNTTDGSKLI